MNNIIAIVGPTASGKTALSIEMAKYFGGEIVSCDSMQIYKRMDIGTAKPTMEERGGIPHHMIDIAEPYDNFSVADFVDMARKCIDDILERGRLPVLVGGTGLYVDSVINNVQFSEGEADFEYREQLKRIAQENGNEYLHSMLAQVDRESYDKLHPNDVRRVIRALEVYKATGVAISEHNRLSKNVQPVYNALMFGLDMDRQVLYERINSRVDKMIESGLLDEVKGILAAGVSENSTAMQAIGYKELVWYLNGNVSFDTAVENIKRESRRYAKRQLTWFRKNGKINWITLQDKKEDMEKLFNFTKKCFT